MKIKHNRGGGGGGGGERWGNSRPTPSDFLCNEERSFSESHSLDSSWRRFQSKARDAKKPSQAGKMQQVHEVVTQCFTWTIHLLIKSLCYVFVCRTKRLCPLVDEQRGGFIVKSGGPFMINKAAKHQNVTCISNKVHLVNLILKYMCFPAFI